MKRPALQRLMIGRHRRLPTLIERILFYWKGLDQGFPLLFKEIFGKTNKKL